jgi:phosphoribosyl 1,2-cyclic phosphodiesterase
MGNQDNQVAITFWGVRGSTPCANRENMEFGGNTTCLEVHLPHSEEILILDSGTGIRNLGNKLDSEKSGEISGRIFITHPHWDHIQGFPFFKPIYGSANHFDIHMPEQENGGCKEILSGHLTKTFFPVTLKMIDANLSYITQPQERVQYDGYEIEFMLANHTIKTAAYKIRINGKQIVFCPDNELDPDRDIKGSDFYDDLKYFFEDVDLLIHDGQYNIESYEGKQGWGHSPWEEVVDFACQSGVKHLFITHHDPDSDDFKLQSLDKKLQNKFADSFESVQLARENQKIVL